MTLENIVDKKLKVCKQHLKKLKFPIHILKYILQTHKKFHILY